MGGTHVGVAIARFLKASRSLSSAGSILFAFYFFIFIKN